MKIQPAITTRKIKSGKVLEAGNSNGDLTNKVGMGEVEVGDICEPLKPRCWEADASEVIGSKAGVPERGEVEERRV